MQPIPEFCKNLWFEMKARDIETHNRFVLGLLIDEAGDGPGHLQLDCFND